MGSSEPSMVTFPRLKREDHQRTKHDSAFSHWKILIGSCDWKDHSLGTEGTERYRVHNLPKSCSTPGLYELGMVGALTGLKTKATKLNPDYIVVVYVGQADSVRTRMQQYGRFGAHLENGSGLFRDVFSRGYSIVFRWASMRNKQEAEKTEAQLLAKFDYAWNKGSNGMRRSGDVLQKLEKISSSTKWLPKFVKRLKALNQKQVGVRINAIKPHLPDDVSDKNGNNLLAQIFKFGKSRPRVVSDTSDLNVDNSRICGVALGDDSICERTPIKGRKRCADHKGMKISGSISKFMVADKKTNVHNNSVKLQSFSDKYFCTDHTENFSYDTGNLPQESDKCTDDKACTPMSGLASDNSSPCKRPLVERKLVKKDFNIICGVNLGEGRLCERTPVKGRKRCKEHKGMRVAAHTMACGTTPKEQSSSLSDATAMAGSFIGLNAKASFLVCGIMLQDGSSCSRIPPHGRKRCDQHKGMRVTS